MIGSVNILLVDEPRWTAKISRKLEREDSRFDITVESDSEGGMAQLREGGVDCILSAHDLPEHTGIDFLHAVREIDPSLPFVIITERGSETIASEAISADVTDYYIKDAEEYWYSILANRIAILVEAYRSERIVNAARSNWKDLEERPSDLNFMFSSDWDELLYINRVYEEVWGASLEELREEPTSFLRYIHPDDRDAAVESMSRLSSGEPTDIEYRVQPPESPQRWVRGVSAPVFNQDGDVVRILGTVRDITPNKEREQRFRAVFEDAFDAMVITDDDGTYVQVNDAACDLFGLPEEELLGRNVAEFAGPDYDVEQEWSAFRESNGQRGRFPLRRPDGSTRIVEYAATTSIVQGEHLSILRDITEQESQRLALAESEARYETLVEDVLDTSSVGTFILDENFDVVWINRATEVFFGVEREDILGESKAELVRTELMQKVADPDGFAERLLATYDDNTATERFECRIRDEATGNWRWLSHESQPIRNGLYEGGRIEHYTDITDIKERDRQLQVLARVLRHNQHNKMNVVLGGAETIASDAGGETKQHAERIIRAATELLELSEKQRRIVELVTETVDRQEIDLTERLGHQLERLREEFPDAEVSSTIPSDLSVLAVPGIEEGIGELVENSIVHSDADPVVDVTLSESSEQVTVAVTDANPPIPELEMSVLYGYEEIDQLIHSRGLGLWFVNWSVAKSDGTITFDRVNDGNRVRITLGKPD